MSIDVAFFGCWKEAGHYLKAKGGAGIRDAEREQLPDGRDLDGSRLFLPYPAIRGEGKRTYLPALNVTVLSWWNNVYDTRPGVNSHVIRRGDNDASFMWLTFTHNFPEIAPDHAPPRIVVQL